MVAIVKAIIPIPEKILPIATVPTTPAATNDEYPIKREPHIIL